MFFDAETILTPMTMIDLLKQPRFVPLPEHTHNYLELVYVCSGSSAHIINDSEELTLKKDEFTVPASRRPPPCRSRRLSRYFPELCHPSCIFTISG